MTRLERIRCMAAENNIAAVVLVPGTNFFYFTDLGMKLSERITAAFIPVEGEPFVICPKLEAEKVRATGWQVFAWSDEAGPHGVAKEVLNKYGLAGKILACEYQTMRLMEKAMLERALGNVTVIDADPLLAEMRMVKDADEAAKMETAAKVVEAAVEAARQVLRPGVTEYEVSLAIQQTIRAHGGVGDCTVVSGLRGSSAHASTSNKAIENGETVIVDIWGTHQGYYGDITRTFAIGEISDELKKIYQVVYDAQAHARASSKPGMNGEELDALARDYITEHGYGDYFIHRTGHGLGLDVHEEPYVVKGNHRPFVPGNAFTIEPGIYVPGVGGVRIEDDAIMTQDGCHILTNYPRELIVIK